MTVTSRALLYPYGNIVTAVCQDKITLWLFDLGGLSCYLIEHMEEKRQEIIRGNIVFYRERSGKGVTQLQFGVALGYPEENAQSRYKQVRNRQPVAQ